MPIKSEQDLSEMYSVHKSKQEVTLWCYTNEEPSNQCKLSSAGTSQQTPAPKRTCDSILTAVQSIVEDLKKLHGSKYTVERFVSWAHMINMGRHSLLEEPPNLPFFGRKKSKRNESTSPGATVASPAK